MYAGPADEPEREYVITPPPGQDVVEAAGAVFGYPAGTVLAVRDRPGIARVVFAAVPTRPGEGRERPRQGTRVKFGNDAVWQIRLRSGGYARGAFAETFDANGRLLGRVGFPAFSVLEPRQLRLYAPYLIREITPHYYVWKAELTKAVRAATLPDGVPSRNVYGEPGYIDDLDGDGLPEIIMTSEHPRSPGERYIRILTVLDGDGRFEKRAGVRFMSPWSSGFGITFIPPTDLDGDGVKDLIVWLGTEQWTAGSGRTRLFDGVFAVDFAARLPQLLKRKNRTGDVRDAVFESGEGPNCVHDCPNGPLNVSISNMTADVDHDGRSEFVHATRIDRFTSTASRSDCVLEVYRKQNDTLTYDATQSRTIPTVPGSTCEFAVECLAGSPPPGTQNACPK